MLCSEHVYVEMHGNIKVSCPLGDHIMTSYVLKEQNDWFEDEIKFIRQIVQENTKFIDVGASYGLYSLSVARLCSKGHVWAYEPCPKTADHMTESLKINQIENVSLSRKALSNKLGMGVLQINFHSELNGLTSSMEKGELVALSTLDIEQTKHGWSDIDIIKIDVEEHEYQVVEGGEHFFKMQSPLVMCEILGSTKMHLDAPQLLMQYGYSLYRVAPGLSALVPLDLNQQIDRHQLNIFCCKPDRASTLLERNKLVMSPPKSVELRGGIWQDFVLSFGFGREGKHLWELGSLKYWAEYETALNLYALSRSLNEKITCRYGALQASYKILSELINKETTIPRLVSYARVAVDIGAKTEALRIFTVLLQIVQKHGGNLPIKEPFISSCVEFEDIAPNGNILGWLASSILDCYERLRRFTSHGAAPETTLGIVNELKRMGFCTPQMGKRGNLVASLKK